MVSDTAISAANYLANHYVVGSDKVGGYRKMMPDYKGYVQTITPLLDSLITTNNQVMTKRKQLGLPTW